MKIVSAGNANILGIVTNCGLWKMLGKLKMSGLKAEDALNQKKEKEDFIEKIYRAL